MNPAAPSLWTALRRYIAIGWRIVPNYALRNGVCTCPAGPACTHSGKHPRLRDWPQAATADLPTLHTWLQRWPDLQPGIATGRGLLALDVDARHGGVRWLVTHRALLPPTVQQRTGSGGLHLLYRVPPGIPIRTTNQGQLAPGVDTRGEGGQIIVAPARNRAGPYRWLPGHAPWEHPLTPAPAALLALLTYHGIVGSPLKQRRCLPLITVPADFSRPDANHILDRYLYRAYPGCRNTQGFHLALQLRDNGYSCADALRTLRAYQGLVDDPAAPYRWAEALASVQQAYRRAPRLPWHRPGAYRPLPEED